MGLASIGWPGPRVLRKGASSLGKILSTGQPHVRQPSFPLLKGLPVKIWGFFGNGQLHYYVLPKDGQRTTNMTGDTYEWLVSDRFSTWRRACFGDDARVHLVQDHEKCLWQDHGRPPLHPNMKNNYVNMIFSYPMGRGAYSIPGSQPSGSPQSWLHRGGAASEVLSGFERH